MGFSDELQKMSPLRMRALVTILTPLLAILAAIWVDPDPGDLATTQVLLAKWLMVAAMFSFAVLLVGWTWDYKEADTQAHCGEVLKGNTASAFFLLGKFALIAAVFLGLMFGVTKARAGTLDVRSYVPPNCAQLAKLLKKEQARLWAAHPLPAFEIASVEQETCVRLDSARCCTGKARLLTEREEGATFLQVTRTFRKDGSLRFDKLAELRDRHAELADWSWNNVYDRDDLGARALILTHRDDYMAICRTFGDKLACMPFVAYGHNGGLGAVIEDRQLCGLKRGCNNKVWWGNVELTSSKSRASLGPRYGNRSPHDISREYPRMVLLVRMPKYRSIMT